MINYVATIVFTVLLWLDFSEFALGRPARNSNPMQRGDSAWSALAERALRAEASFSGQVNDNELEAKTDDVTDMPSGQRSPFVVGQLLPIRRQLERSSHLI